ncbi:MAG: hypothetical protein Q7K03_03500 [Dehalococcoidia bacterium]|nr:hypothetical protein [Dehalococcoidia bacterium]
MVVEKKKVLYPPKKHISDEILELAKKTSTATITGTLELKGFRWNIYMAHVLPFKPGAILAGRAYTFRYLPRRDDLPSPGDYPQEEVGKYARNLAIESLHPGDVLVVDARGNTNAAIFGDHLVARMKYLKAAGLVTDGALRDSPYMRNDDFPVFARGSHGYSHPHEHWAADVQLPIACGEVTVFPGDLIVGDGDGVVVCPQAIAEEVIKESVLKEQEEDFSRELLKKGYSVNDTHGRLSASLQAEYQKWRKAHKL